MNYSLPGRKASHHGAAALPNATRLVSSFLNPRQSPHQKQSLLIIFKSLTWSFLPAPRPVWGYPPGWGYSLERAGKPPEFPPRVSSLLPRGSWLLGTSICLLSQKISTRKEEEYAYFRSATGHMRNSGKLLDGLNPGFSGPSSRQKDLQNLESINTLQQTLWQLYLQMRTRFRCEMSCLQVNTHLNTAFCTLLQPKHFSRRTRKWQRMQWVGCEVLRQQKGPLKKFENHCPGPAFLRASAESELCLWRSWQAG